MNYSRLSLGFHYTNIMDEARKDAGDVVEFQDAEAMKSVLRLYLLDMGAALSKSSPVQ